MTTKSVTIQQHIAAPLHAVWAAITQPDMLPQWWATGDILPTIGHQFTMDMNQWGKVPCTVTECEPETKLTYTFGTWALAWTLSPTDTGTLLTLEHSGFDTSKEQDVFALKNMGTGWRTAVLPRLGALLEREAA